MADTYSPDAVGKDSEDSRKIRINHCKEIDRHDHQIDKQVLYLLPGIID